MAVKAISGSDKDQELIIDTLKHARRQEYTPQRLCELQKIIETQYYYWWIMDMKKEEFCLELFDEDFQYYYNGYLASTKPEEQARTSKWVNAPLATMHMGHQPLVWLMDEKNARGIFQYEDHQVYRESGEIVETWMVYCNDFCKDEKGIWHIKTMRMIKRQADGRYHDINPPEGWMPEEWDTCDF